MFHELHEPESPIVDLTTLAAVTSRAGRLRRRRRLTARAGCLVAASAVAASIALVPKIGSREISATDSVLDNTTSTIDPSPTTSTTADPASTSTIASTADPATTSTTNPDVTSTVDDPAPAVVTEATPQTVLIGPSETTTRQEAALTGSGSTMAKLAIDQWRAEVRREPIALDVSYVAEGSAAGRADYIAGRADFAAIDVPFDDGELADLRTRGKGDFTYVPIASGTVGVLFNLQTTDGTPVTSLRLTARAICRMFTADEMFWDDPEIRATNTVDLPHSRIVPYVQDESSGSSLAMGRYCSQLASDIWAPFVAAHTGSDVELAPATWPDWPAGRRVRGTNGLAAAVDDHANSVTFIEAGYGIVRGIPAAAIENAAGTFVRPSQTAVSRFLTSATADASGLLVLDLLDASKDAYPIAEITYAVAPTAGVADDSHRGVATFLCYAVTTGQRFDLTDTLGYAQLPRNVTDAAIAAIMRIPGADPAMCAAARV